MHYKRKDKNRAENQKYGTMRLRGSLTREVKIMSLSDKQNANQVPTSDEIWQILKKTAKYHERTAKRQDEMAKHYDKMAKHQDEMAKRQDKMAKHQDEMAKRYDEMVKRHDEMAKRQDEADKKAHKKMDRLDDRIDKMRGIWSNAWGDFVESLVSGRFVELVQAWIPSINQIMKNIECKRNGQHCEIDIIAVNSDSLVATEVKSTLNVTDVKEFLEKLKSFTMFFPQFKGYKIYGAVAYLKTTQNAEKFAMKKGLFVIHATGDSGEILNEKGIFKPQIIEQINYS